MPRAKRVLEHVLEEARQLGHCYIAPKHILLGLIREGEGAGCCVIGNLGGDLGEIRTRLIEMILRKDKLAEAGAGVKMENNNVNVLEDYGTNLTELAKEGKLDQVIGREELIERVIRILRKRLRKTPILVGANGVGKTAIVEGLAKRIASGNVPESIQGKKVIKLDMRLLVAREKDREKRLRNLIEVLEKSDDIIHFIDEVKSFIGAVDDDIDGAIDAAIVLRHALSCVYWGYFVRRVHYTDDPALGRHIEPINVPEPSVNETVEILKAFRERFDTYHNVRYTDESLVAAAKLSRKCFSDRHLPDKAIDLMDDAGSRARFHLTRSHAQVQKEVTARQIELGHVISDKLKALQNQDFEKACDLHDRERDLKVQISEFDNKEIKADETDKSEGLVTEEDIQDTFLLDWMVSEIPMKSQRNKKAVMARALVQSTASLPWVHPTINFSQSNRMFRISPAPAAPPLRLNLRSFSGLNSFVVRCEGGRKLFYPVVHAIMDTALAFASGKAGKVPKPSFDGCTEKAKEVLKLAEDEARLLGHNFIDTEHILLGLLHEDDTGNNIAAKVLESVGINLQDARLEVEKLVGRGSGFVAEEIPFTLRATRVLESLKEVRRELYGGFIGPEHILFGLIREGEGVGARVLENLGGSEIRLRVIEMLHETYKQVEKEEEEVVNKMDGVSLLEEYGSNLTELAKQGELNPLIGKQEEIQHVIRTLCRRSKNIPILIGEELLWNIKIIRSVAQRIANGDVPETLQRKEVIQLDMRLLLAREENREERLNKLIEEIKQRDCIVVFPDEVQAFIGPHSDVDGAVDAATILRSALSRGELQCIGATTMELYKRYMKEDPALDRHMDPIKVAEPSVDEIVESLNWFRGTFETLHNVQYTDESLVAAAKLSQECFKFACSTTDTARKLMNAAGSRVECRLKQSHAKVQEEVAALQTEIGQVNSDKLEALENQDFEKAFELHEEEENLMAQIAVIYEDRNEAETESDGVVTEEDIRDTLLLDWNVSEIPSNDEINQAEASTL
ncbi:OLC1v1000774C1 [Oldenlandia corymbosa var. corymbosa]|uniref:OLC1v1000774C1 n=1 Tax=Oldenlandia corymbosa var. corymbosa TaxID=529605 RepID=A0AAV1D6G1_OLDCO|nr:OLC1v1000774C1 [Oldenlandia corymbosa var. corymbosa]